MVEFYRTAAFIYRIGVDIYQQPFRDSPCQCLQKKHNQSYVLFCLRRPEQQSSSALNGVQLPLVFIFFVYFSTKIP